MPSSRPRPILQELSPWGDLWAVLEQDERCAWLYLRRARPRRDGGGPGGIVRAVWVRNLAPAAAGLAEIEARSPRAPMLPAAACAYASGAPPLDPAALRLVWTPSGLGVTLRDSGCVLAQLPDSSADSSQPGYARDCLRGTPLAAPLPPELAEAAPPPLPDPATPARLRGAVEDALASVFGLATDVARIDGGVGPARSLYFFRSERAWILATAGVSARPQPQLPDPPALPPSPDRFELALALEPGIPASDLPAWGAAISGLAALPWLRGLRAGPERAFPWQAPLRSAEAFDSVLLLADPPSAPVIPLPAPNGESSRLLWLLPLRAAERELGLRLGAAALLCPLDALGAAFIHRRERPTATRTCP
jgi:hypothetical protein